MVSESTKLARIQFIKSISNNLNDFNNIDLVMNRVNDTENEKTRSTRMFHIMEYLKEVDSNFNVIKKIIFDQYNKIKEEYKKKQVYIEQENILKDAHKQKYDTLNNLKTILYNSIDNLNKKYNIRSMTKSDFKLLKKPELKNYAKHYQNLLMLACYILQQSLRTDWCNILIYNSFDEINNIKMNKDNNYLMIKKNKLIMNNYKHSTKTIEIKINSELMILIRIWIKILDLLMDDEYDNLFYYTFNKMNIIHTSNPKTFALYIKRNFENYMNKNLTINDMRHIHEIELQNSDKYKKMTINQKINEHNNMLHGLTTSMKYNLIEQ